MLIRVFWMAVPRASTLRDGGGPDPYEGVDQAASESERTRIINRTKAALILLAFAPSSLNSSSQRLGEGHARANGGDCCQATGADAPGFVVLLGCVR